MRAIGNRRRAERLSTLVDELIRDPDAQPPAVDLVDDRLLETARQLVQLPQLLGPVHPALEQRVLRAIRPEARQEPEKEAPRRELPVESERSGRLRPGWVVAGLVTMVLVAAVLSPFGQTAVASFMAVFHLGRTDVSITPVNGPGTRFEEGQGGLLATAAVEDSAVRQRLSLTEARDLVPFKVPEPGYLPAGYRLEDVSSYSYPGLPAWVPQPLFVELVYSAGAQEELTLRIYPIMLGDQATIARLDLQATPIRDVQDVDIHGQPGVLLQLGAQQEKAVWQEVVWEQGDLILALSAADLTPAELLRIAQSVR